MSTDTMPQAYVLDIETIPLAPEDRTYGTPTADTVKYGNTKDPDKRAKMVEKAVEEWREGPQCALKAEYGQIAMIGLQQLGSNEIEIFSQDDVIGEDTMLIEFFERLDDLKIQDTLIGHNLKSFDLPFIIRRCMILGLGHLQGVAMMRRAVKRYDSELIFDTMQEWACGDRQTYIKLEILAAALGIKVEPQEVKGKDFYKWFAKDPEKCKQYLTNDIVLTSAVYAAMGK